MRLSDGLKAKRAELLDRMEALSKKAEEENRLFDESEARAFDAAEAEVKKLDRDLERQLAAEALARGDRGGTRPLSPAPGLIAEDGTVLRALKPTDKLADLVQRRPDMPQEPVSVGAVLRGIVFGNWRGVGKPLERAVGETGDSVFPVPEYISNTWLDMARAASVAFKAGAITIPMRSLTERIIGVTQDPVFTYRKEHKPIPECDIVLGGINLKARLCGALVRTSIELLEDSPIANELIQQVLINAAAQKIDWSLLAADGDQTGDLDNPTGLLNWPGVPAIPGAAPMVNYDAVVDAYGSVLANNGDPSAMIAGTGLATAAMKVKTGIAGDNTILAPPQPIANLPKYFSSTMGTSAAVGDFSMLAWGLRTGVTIEATRVGGDNTFKQAQVLIRLYFRGDTAVLRPKWFAKITGLPAAVEAAAA